MTIKTKKSKFIAGAVSILTFLMAGCSDKGSEPTGNLPPTITSPASIAAVVDLQFNFTITASDPDGDVITIEFVNLPSWLSSTSHAISGIAQAGMADTSFKVVASDGVLTDSLAMFLRIVQLNEVISFADSIQPIFSNNCVGCHVGGAEQGGLRLDNHMLVIQGGTNGPVVNVFLPNESRIVRKLEGTEQPQMPYQQPPLPQSQIDLIREWISQGALDN